MYNIDVSVSFIHSLLKSKLIYSNKAQRSTKKAFKKALKEFEKAKEKDNTVTSQLYLNQFLKECFQEESVKQTLVNLFRWMLQFMNGSKVLSGIYTLLLTMLLALLPQSRRQTRNSICLSNNND
jgi:hypothetical protein